MIGNLEFSKITEISEIALRDQLLFSIKNMPRQAKSKEEIQKRKQEREREYRLNSEVKAKKREQDRLYQQRKREQARLQQHEDSLAQLADIATQQQYLKAQNELINEPMNITSRMEESEPIDVGGMIEEDGEILENSMVGRREEEFDDKWEDNFDENFERDENENGINGLEITNDRAKYDREETKQ